MPKNPHIEMTLALALLPNKRLQQENDDARWAEFGRAIHSNLLDVYRLEKVITTTALKPGATGAHIAHAVRIYLTTGTMP